MNITIIYFSGTGTTAFVTAKIVDALKDTTDSIQSIPVEKALEEIEHIKFSTGTILGIVYPVYDLCAPEIIERFIEKLPSQTVPRPVFIFSTQGLIRLDCNGVILNRLKQKNYFIIARGGFKMPLNGLTLYGSKKQFIVYNYVIRFEQNIAKKINAFSKRIIKGYDKFKKKPFSLKAHTFKLVNRIRTFSVHLVGDKIYRDLQVTPGCTLCGLCTRLCPDNNLVITNNKLTIKKSNDCMRCLRCITRCPAKAINFTSASRKGDYNAKIIDERYTEFFKTAKQNNKNVVSC